MYVPMCVDLGNALSGCGMNVWQQAGKKRDEAEHYAYPTDDRDWAWAFVHARAVELKCRWEAIRRSLRLLRCWLAKRALYHVARVRGHRSIAPQPAHHLRHNSAAKLLPVEIHSPRVVHIVPFLPESFHQPHILKEPVALLVVDTIA